MQRYRLACSFLALLYILGPGVLVNLLFKEHWGRPRPVNIVEFGGTQQYVLLALRETRCHVEMMSGVHSPFFVFAYISD